jgi:hypothetical protein
LCFAEGLSARLKDQPAAAKVVIPPNEKDFATLHEAIINSPYVDLFAWLAHEFKSRAPCSLFASFLLVCAHNARVQ